MANVESFSYHVHRTALNRHTSQKLRFDIAYGGVICYVAVHVQVIDSRPSGSGPLYLFEFGLHFPCEKFGRMQIQLPVRYTPIRAVTN
ncbi:hypothetical protein RvY_02002 [Ramazzottius varieornatus]|uniref:Uncharacterized protein n=1 Tax=Ramazzottius varieornatus TaxID=947166 RepID=A0A1D1USW4_RAMVA|nr:hypothetical protein RvY_02002 [Ramazzottius varieornatus]